MRIAVLLSAGRHPVSGRAMLPCLEAQAIRLAGSLGGTVVGLHAGPDSAAVPAALGHGLERLVHLEIGEADDPVPSLAAELDRAMPDLILAGRRSSGGDETGLVPYLLAERLGIPILADAVTLARDGNGLAIDQALPKGLRRRIRTAGPVLATVHPSAPPPEPYALARERRGVVEPRAGSAASTAEPERPEERPLRPRAKLIRGSAGGSAADRLKAATEMAKGAGGEVLIDTDPETAARVILAHLRRIGALAEDSHPER